MASGAFATAINCMDGRAILPVTEWMKKQCQVDYVDMITEAGPDKVLSAGSSEQVAAIKARVGISVGKHNSKVIAVVGHHDCAGNPVSRAEHLEHIKECCRIVGTWGLDVRIYGLWLNEQWEVEVVYDSAGG